MSDDLRVAVLGIGWPILALLLAWITVALAKPGKPAWPMRLNLALARRPGAAFSAREQFLTSFFFYLFAIVLLGVAGSALWRGASKSVAKRDRHVVWLPYSAGDKASVLQGAFGTFTHKDIHAWDFGLAEGRPVAAVADGRVIRVIDERDKSGFNSFNESNQVFVDHGGGMFATYLHHATGTARVIPGQLVAAGTHLADVGKVGTLAPHIHFDVRGPSWHKTHDVRFRAAGGDLTEARQGERYASATPAAQQAPAEFRDSILQGDEFAANGIALRQRNMPARTAFRIRADTPILFKGRAEGHVQRVFYFLWRDGQPSEYVASAAPYESGNFELEVRVPQSSKGARWYRITGQDAAGRLADVATLPVLVE